MTSSGARPPRIAEGLLAAAISERGTREAILGDLHEEHAARARKSRVRAAGWYWTQAVRLGARAAAQRLASRVTRPSRTEHARTPGGDTFMHGLVPELRYATRDIFKRPVLTLVLVATLALGLGANAAIFAIIDALVLRPFTMRDVDRIVLLAHTRDGDVDRQETVSPANFLDWKKQTDVFERLAAYSWWDANLVGRDEPERVAGFFVSADFLPAMGVQPILGRNFAPEEETIGSRRVILSYGVWQRRFAGDPALIGRAIQIDGAPYEVIGIAPRDFDFPMGAEVWAPLAFDAKAASQRRSRYLTVLGRLAPGRTIEDAKAQIAVVGQRLEQEHPDTNRGLIARVYTLAQGMLDVGLPPILSLWQASAAFLLLIACANVANLLLARGAERQREIAVRLAIGASRGRVVRALLLENATVALASVPIALAVAWISLDALRSAMPARLVRFVAGWQEMGVDARLFAFTSLLAVGTASVFGLIPAFQASRPRLTESLKDGGRSVTSGASRMRLRRALVVSEITLALPLLVVSGLSALSVNRFLYGPQGYDPDGVLLMSLVLGEGKYPDGDAQRRFAHALVGRAMEIPGVQHAAALNIPPAAGNNSMRSIEIEGRPNPDPANPPTVDHRVATPRVFETLGIPIKSGRGISGADREGAQPVAVVSESLARRYWPNEDPLGRRIKVGDGPYVTVVGVCGDVIHDWFSRRNAPTLYRPFAQSPVGYMSLLLRTSGDPTSLASAARNAVRALDPAQPVFDVMTMRARLYERTIGLRYIAAIMTTFGGLALMLAVVGVYGVMAYLVTQRTHEIGVRMALGATARDVLRLAVCQAARLTAIGVGLGILLSLALGRLVEAGLLGSISNDVRVVASVAAILIAAALAAGWIPARRAAAIDPISALRAE